MLTWTAVMFGAARFVSVSN